MFQIGNEVYYAAIGRYGTIEIQINKGDAEDVRQQGPRYEVSVGGELWSVPGRSLSKRKIRSLNTQNPNEINPRKT